jgi:HPr kinase/phosphorylase
MTTTSLHGVFLEIFNKGILLTGNPGIGKSQCALSLLARGHRLIADDLVLVSIENNHLIGKAPDRGFGLLWPRSLGLIDVEQVFGPRQLLAKSPLEFIIHLDENKNKLFTKSILGLHIPGQSIPIRFNQDMAILIETAVKLAFGPKSERVKNFETYNC